MARKERSGCGMRMAARPSSEVKPHRPPAEPLGFQGYTSVGRPGPSPKRRAARAAAAA